MPGKPRAALLAPRYSPLLAVRAGQARRRDPRHTLAGPVGSGSYPQPGLRIKIHGVDALEELLALHAIRNLVVTYAMAFDDHDWERLGSLWTEDASFVVGDQTFNGRDAVMSFLSTCLPEDSRRRCSSPIDRPRRDHSAATV